MPDPATLDAPANYLQLIRIISRAIAVFFLYWAFVSLVAIPRDLLALAHYGLPGQAAVASQTYWTMTYTTDLLGGLIRIVVLCIAAGWFYRCGPRIQRFFSPETFTSPLAPTSNPEP
ncbi:MAG TPA: hypothetical protein VN612_04460 [Acidobacteriaceae bacterium]|nr:hypothetical protein [Acidobacteriaceae bacterium]